MVHQIRCGIIIRGQQFNFLSCVPNVEIIFSLWIVKFSSPIDCTNHCVFLAGKTCQYAFNHPMIRYLDVCENT
jgi:hypothetical protein